MRARLDSRDAPDAVSPTRPVARLRHEPALDGLRGIAVAAVLLYHGGFATFVGGYLGVSTFFTLSGFLITSLLLAEHEHTQRIDLRAFWARRARRILPASYVALALVAAFGTLFADAYQREHLLGDGLSTLAYVVNWWFVATRRDYADIFGSPSPVQHFWSLAIEEQFYVVFPLLVAAVVAWAKAPRRALGIVLAVLCVLSIARLAMLVPTDAPTARLYYGTDTRAAELLIGAVLAVVLRARPLGRSRLATHTVSVLGLIGLAISVRFWTSMHQDDVQLYAGGLPLYAAASTAIVAAAVAPGGPVRALLSLAPLRRLGDVSYGVYLYHFPIFLTLTETRTGLGTASLFVVRVAVTLVVALASLRWLEMPVRSRRVLTGPRAWRAAPLAAATLVLTLLLVTWHAVPPPAPAATHAPVASDSSFPVDGRTRVLVVGDSVAGNVADALDRWARTNGAIVAQATQKGCGLADESVQTSRDEQNRAAWCAGWRAAFGAVVHDFDPDVVVVYTGGWDLIPRSRSGWSGMLNVEDATYRAWLESEYRVMIELLSARGARVVWLAATCVSVKAPARLETFAPAHVHLLNDVIERAVEGASGHARYVDLFSWACPRGAFSNTVHGIADARPDGVHFVPAAADRLAHWLGPQVVNAAPGRRERPPL